VLLLLLRLLLWCDPCNKAPAHQVSLTVQSSEDSWIEGLQHLSLPVYVTSIESLYCNTNKLMQAEVT